MISLAINFWRAAMAGNGGAPQAPPVITYVASYFYLGF